jgi:transposase
MSRFQLLTDAQWSLIEDLLPVRTGKRGRPFQNARSMGRGHCLPIPVRDRLARCTRGVRSVAVDLDLASTDER